MDSCKFDEDPSILNLILDLEVVINCPVQAVWKHWLELGSWVLSHDVDTVHGVPGALGSVMRASNKRGAELGMHISEVPLPHYHYCKIIKIVPEKVYVLKTFSEKGGSYGMDMAGFDQAKFELIGEKTKISYHYIGSYKSPKFIGGPFLKDPDDDDDHMLKNLLNLKRIVEADWGA